VHSPILSYRQTLKTAQKAARRALERYTDRYARYASLFLTTVRRRRIQQRVKGVSENPVITVISEMAHALKSRHIRS
jgi:phage terminase small subunit